MNKSKWATVLLCAVFLMAITLWLVPTRDAIDESASWFRGPYATPAPDNRFLIRHNPHTGRNVRVMVAMISTKMTMPACISVASGHLSGIPVSVVGFHPLTEYNPAHRVRTMLAAARSAELTASDVVFFVDNATLFTDPDQFFAAVDSFIAESAATADELDARAVREGRVRAPMIVSRNHFCNAPQSLGSMETCEEAFNTTSDTYSSYVLSKGMQPHGKRIRYMDSNTYIARLWALEEFMKGLYGYMHQHPAPLTGGEWSSDQSIFNALYLNLRAWEVRQDALTSTAPIALRSEYGLRAGLLAVDERGELATRWVWKGCVMRNEFWLQDPSIEAMLNEEPFTIKYSYHDREMRNHNALRNTRNTSAFMRVVKFIGRHMPSTAVTDRMGQMLRSRSPHYMIFNATGVPTGLSRVPGAVQKVLQAYREAQAYPQLSWCVPMKYNDSSRYFIRRYLRELDIPHNQMFWSSYREMCMEAFDWSDRSYRPAVHPELYKTAPDTYRLLLDYFQ